VDYNQYMSLPKSAQLVIVNIRSLSDSDLDSVFKTTSDPEIIERILHEFERRAKAIQPQADVFYTKAPESGLKVNDKSVVLIKCPRCGFEGDKGQYKKAASNIVGCFLLLLALIPGIFYYVLVGGKLVCPKCQARL